MSTYRISVVNEEFSVQDEEDHPNAATAAEQAIRGALAVGCEQILAGTPFFGAEVEVSDGKNRQRFMVAIGASPLRVD